ncbi:MAG: methyltransferase domain-containing protein [Ignavibacteriales bacterium]|nr:methyltransferase domain-containing protein [Ignavibacteriales bacterium]
MIKLHIGCFDTPNDGWYNTDVTPHIVISRIPLLPTLLHAFGIIDDLRYRQHQSGIFRRVHYLNALKSFPFDADSVGAVYSSHMLYNFTQAQALWCLQEVHRVLAPGGIVRLALIDLDELVRTYDPDKPEEFLEPMYQPSVRGSKNRMKWSYNATSLSALLEQAGFRHIVRRTFKTGDCPDVERIDHRPDSLFMEGTK